MFQEILKPSLKFTGIIAIFAIFGVLTVVPFLYDDPKATHEMVGWVLFELYSISVLGWFILAMISNAIWYIFKK